MSIVLTSDHEAITESLNILRDHEDLRIGQLNQAIDLGLEALNKGNEISAEESYAQLKIKIANMNKAV